MLLKNSLQKVTDGCIRNNKETHCPENSAFPGFCDYEVMKMNILGTDYELIKDCDELTERNVDGECQSYGKVIRIRPLKKCCYQWIVMLSNSGDITR